MAGLPSLDWDVQGSHRVNQVSAAAILSWAVDWRVVAFLLITALVYVRGWRFGRALIREPNDTQRFTAFLMGLFALFLALESPLDTFDRFFLSAHMAQHLLLMMVAPPLLLWGRPTLPLLRGLPKSFVKEGLGPFLSCPELQRFLGILTTPPAAWLIFALSTVLWHIPVLYELAVRDSFWHGLQHACFFWTGILFWWPVILPDRSRKGWPRWAAIPYLLLADGLNTAISAYFIFSDQSLYPSYDLVRIGGMTAREDQAAAGAIMWVPGSLAYLIPAIVIAARLFRSEPAHSTGIRVPRAPRPDLIQISATPATSGASRLPAFRRVAQVALLFLAIAVMADGFTGSTVPSLNLAGTLPWIHWRALSVLALLLFGNLFCMICPFTLVRDWSRRLLPARWSARQAWPHRLRGKWLPLILTLVFFWAYEAFSLWNSPWITAWIILGYFTGAVLVDSCFRGASFCKYVCPIGQFHFVASLVSPAEVRVRNRAVCDSCLTFDCIRGNERVRGCELDLFQPKKVGNMDCTFCLDCVAACPHDNVAILRSAPIANLSVDTYRSSVGRLSNRNDIAALVLLIVFGAFTNAAGMVAPVLMWEHRWHAAWGSKMMPAVVALFVSGGALAVPSLIVLLTAAYYRLLRDETPVARLLRHFTLGLIPLGVAMWAAHLFFHLAGVWSLAYPPAASAIKPIQLLLLDGGVLLALYSTWRIARQHASGIWHRATLSIPWAAFSLGLYAAGVWILFQPMQMRGMIH